MAPLFCRSCPYFDHHHLAAKAHKDGLLADEILAVNGNKDDNGVRADSSYEKLSTLKVTAATVVAWLWLLCVLLWVVGSGLGAWRVLHTHSALLFD